MELGATERPKFVGPGMQELVGGNRLVSEAVCTWGFGWGQKGAAVILQVQLSHCFVQIQDLHQHYFGMDSDLLILLSLSKMPNLLS